jgi:ABC-2 type transport system permease protein
MQRAGASLFRIRLAEGLQYRMAALSGAMIACFWALIEVTVATVFFKYGDNAAASVNGLSLPQAVSYMWLAQFTVGLHIPAIDGDLMTKIVNGDIGVELCRPLDLYWHWYARTAAGKVSKLLLQGGFVIIGGAALSVAGLTDYGLGLPASPLNLILFLISMFNALIASTACGMLFTAVRIGVTWGDGPLNMIILSTNILAGAYVPLQLWPDFMQTFLQLQPFAWLNDAPSRLYVGSVDIRGGLVSLAVQLIWLVVFIAAGRSIVKRKLKSVVIQGG